MTALLEIANLDVHFALADGDVHAVKNASLTIQEGECLGVVGESGSAGTAGCGTDCAARNSSALRCILSGTPRSTSPRPRSRFTMKCVAPSVTKKPRRW